MCVFFFCCCCCCCCCSGVLECQNCIMAVSWSRLHCVVLMVLLLSLCCRHHHACTALHARVATPYKVSLHVFLLESTTHICRWQQ
jgi:hypothetical protein